MSDTREGETAEEAGKGDVDSEGEAADIDDADTVDEGDAETSNRESTGKGGTQPPLHPKDQRLNVGVVLGSVLLSAVTSLVICLITISSAREQSVEDFRRDNKEDNYAYILSQATNLGNATEFAVSNLDFISTNPYFYGIGSYEVARNDHYSCNPQRNPDGTIAETSGGCFSATYGYRPYQNAYSSLGSVRSDWQGSYARLDQAIAEAQIAGEPETLGLARALRDRYRNDYAVAVDTRLDEINKRAEDAAELFRLQQNSPDRRGVVAPSFTSAPMSKDMAEAMRRAQVNEIVGVGEPDPAASGYPENLLANTARDLTIDYIKAVQVELSLTAGT